MNAVHCEYQPRLSALSAFIRVPSSLNSSRLRTARAVRNAALQDLEKAPGISATVARKVYDYFHPGG